MYSYDPAALLFNLYCGIIRHICVTERVQGKETAVCAHFLCDFDRGKLPSVKHNAQYMGASGNTLSLCFFSVFVCRCVEIIAKEGRSLKELYLVSCKITDHGRILGITVPMLHSSSRIILLSQPLLPTGSAMFQDSFDFTAQPL